MCRLLAYSLRHRHPSGAEAIGGQAAGLTARQSTLPAGRQETDCRLPIGRAGRYIDAVPLFWLNYRNTERRAVAIVEAEALVAARMKAAPTGLDVGMDFAGGNELDEASSQQIPEHMIGRLLDDGDLRRLRRAVMPKKPRSPSVPRTARRVGKR